MLPCYERHFISSNQDTKLWLKLVTLWVDFTDYMLSYLLICHFQQDNLDEQEVSEEDSDQEAQSSHVSIPAVSLVKPHLLFGLAVLKNNMQGNINPSQPLYDWVSPICGKLSDESRLTGLFRS